MSAPEVIEVERKRVACDGGGGTLGHPKIYLEMGAAYEVICPYCSRRFVFKERTVVDAED
mgnify:FL=1